MWRDAIRDSGLKSTDKAVAHCLSTYMNASGLARPSVDTLALGTSFSDRTVQAALRRIAKAGYLDVEWSLGGSCHRFAADLPPTANELRRREWSAARNGEPDDTNGEADAPNGEAASPESIESDESRAVGEPDSNGHDPEVAQRELAAITARLQSRQRERIAEKLNEESAGEA